MSDPRLTPDARARRTRTLRWVVPLVIGVPLLAVLLVVTLRVSIGAGVALLVVGLAMALAGWALQARDRRRADRLAPADPALRTNPPLDVARVRALRSEGGHVAAVREVRRQAPWLTLAEAVDLSQRIG
ncbi:hypothetical protein [Cellulomonas pakistanensis]|uniref:Uncharacterized protein n=1 Tax=Cellulomonas pakistanensis TaxID=992287 RepID=A0A919P6L1_9CELL|nr:hypothetical protein [Cellulomonas pakistanensis]GIG35294.1 hypothetical protein Cpa01nite_06750 [Cellulomonas pakistanensis]